MDTTENSLLTITARDLMSSPVEVVPQEMPLRSAARLLVRAQVSGAPVVDEEGRCVGVLSAHDFVRWAEEGAQGVNDGPLLACPYQLKGRLLTGEEATICKLAEGSCALQSIRATTGGRHTAVCLLPRGSHGLWRWRIQDLPRGAVCRYMTTDVVKVSLETPLPELARRMVEAHIHRVVVVDEQGKPVGIVSSTDVLAAISARTKAPPRTEARPAAASLHALSLSGKS